MTAAIQDQFSRPLTYLADIDRYHLLTATQELRLARRYRRTGDPRAARILVVRNLRFVVKVASDFRRYGLDMKDLVQEGNVGLLRAVEKFEPERGHRLITYAVWWIRAHMQEFILRSWSLVRLGTTQAQRRLFFSLARTKREMAQADGETPSTETVARRLRVTPAEIISMEQRLEGRDTSLDVPRGDGGPRPMALVASRDALADEALESDETRRSIAKRVSQALGRLDPRERYIIEHRHLLEVPRSFLELGGQFGFSPERARQLEARARAKLRTYLGGFVAPTVARDLKSAGMWAA